MNDGPNIAGIAALLGDPARANMLTALLDGRALTVSELAQAGVATLASLARAAEERRAIDFYMSQFQFASPFVLPPETPAAVVATARRALAETLEDPELVAEAAKLGVIPGFMSGERLTSTVEGLYATPAEVVKRVNAAMATK